MAKKRRTKEDDRLIRRLRRRVRDLGVALTYQCKEISRLNNVISDLNPSHYADGM